MKPDKEILDNIEKHLDKFIEAFYDHSEDSIKVMIASFTMGLIAGELMSRGNYE